MTIQTQKALLGFRPVMRSKGFTLLELMIVVTIIAILAGVAIPNYLRYAYRAHRADGKEMLMRVAAAQERYFTNFNQYATDMATLGFTAPSCGAAGDSEKCYYNVGIANVAGNLDYTLTATPKGDQLSDKCAALILKNTGAKTYGGNDSNGSCW